MNLQVDLRYSTVTFLPRNLSRASGLPFRVGIIPNLFRRREYQGIPVDLSFEASVVRLVRAVTACDSCLSWDSRTATLNPKQGVGMISNDIFVWSLYNSTIATLKNGFLFA